MVCWTKGSSLGKVLGNLLGGNSAFADDSPASVLVGKVDNRGSDLTRRNASIDDDGDSILQLIADCNRRRAFGRAAQIRGGCSNRQSCGAYHLQRNLRRRNAQRNIAGVSRYLQR